VSLLKFAQGKVAELNLEADRQAKEQIVAIKFGRIPGQFESGVKYLTGANASNPISSLV